MEITQLLFAGFGYMLLLFLFVLETRRNREIVICAAVRLPDGRIFVGHRHQHALATAREVVEWNCGEDPGPHHWRKLREAWFSAQAGAGEDEAFMAQGFITSRNRFVGRVEAYELQQDAGIQSKARDGYRNGRLFSEDLY